MLLRPSVTFEQCHLRAIVPRRTATIAIKSAAPINASQFSAALSGKERRFAIPSRKTKTVSQKKLRGVTRSFFGGAAIGLKGCLAWVAALAPNL